MLRNEIQNKTGLTRKAIEYYEEKGLIKPEKSENGYREYSEEDFEILTKISLFRKLGINISEIEELLSSDGVGLGSMLRKKQHKLDIEEKRKNILELIIKGESQETINKKISLIENEETIYEKLQMAFPGYFGQMLFSAYQPFLNESLNKVESDAFDEYIHFLDSLPNLDLNEYEKEYIEKLSSAFDMNDLKNINNSKIEAVNSAEKWLEEHDTDIKKYKEFKNSDEYLNSPLKQIQDKLQKFMIDNSYYETAIPLIRKFSKSYDDYYKKLLKANDKYV